jgi:membrane protein required for colicin V production
MHFFDITVLIFLSVFVILGLKRGLVREIFRLAAVLGGFFGALVFYKKACSYADFISIPNATRTALVFLLTYICFAVVILSVGWVVRKIVHLSMLGWADRLLGGVIGLAKAAILIWILMLCIAAVPMSPVFQVVSQSKTFTFFKSIPVRLDSIPPAQLLKYMPSASSIKQPLEKVKDARERIDSFREKVDSAKTFADSLRHPTSRFKD